MLHHIVEATEHATALRYYTFKWFLESKYEMRYAESEDVDRLGYIYLSSMLSISHIEQDLVSI